jgi:Tfp pilus assembly protein PilE
MLEPVELRLEENRRGFTRTELLVLIIVSGVLIGIAIPSYLGFRERVADSHAQANLRAAVWSAEAYYADHGTYSQMDAADLVAFDAGLSRSITVAGTGPKMYCLTSTVSGNTWSVRGGAGSATDGLTAGDCS